MKESKLNKVEITRKGSITEIKINDKEITFVGKYSITQDIDVGSGIPILEIKMAIDEEKSTITI